MTTAGYLHILNGRIQLEVVLFSLKRSLQTFSINISFGDLKDDQRLEVRTAQRLSQKWRNERDLGKIYLTSCSKVARFDTGNPKSQPCFQTQRSYF
jgi:hypothetical protein